MGRIKINDNEKFCHEYIKDMNAETGRYSNWLL